MPRFPRRRPLYRPLYRPGADGPSRPPWRLRRAGEPTGPAPPAEASPLALLMGRDEVVLAGRRGHRLVAGRRVLVTGACGTVGSAFCHQVKNLDPAALCLVDRDGARLRHLGQEMTGTLDAERVMLAETDVSERDAVDDVFRAARPELVFHTAGQNELAKVELRPSRGVTANVLGTRHVVDASVLHGVARMVFVSSDKAADPTSVLGATMRLGELLTQGAIGGPTCFAAVRIGNVIGEPGALLSTLAHRISSHEVVTITHPEVARHFMTVTEAAGLLLEAAALAEEAETFVLDMGSPVPVIELVHRYAEQLRLPEVTIRFSGLGPGEKLAEKTFADSERRIRTAHPKIWATRPAPPPAGLPQLLDALCDAARGGDDDEVRLLLRRLLPEYHPVRRPRPQREPGGETPLCDAGCSPDPPGL
ncbi:SDR family NAD(P)-dependent oxidoreductase [Actinomadura fulvescens]|uniref:Polysaccharide biosynthesis protein CapD-like domain-containing protein n=1 Tax=Actinomadura fulvescens TaxID=46160 RepID=A0ABP6C1Y9_9ACTN